MARLHTTPEDIEILLHPLQSRTATLDVIAKAIMDAKEAHRLLDWQPGLPPEGVKAAWLKLVLEDAEDELDAWVELGVHSFEGWCQASSWTTEAQGDTFESLDIRIVAWKPYEIPS